MKTINECNKLLINQQSCSIRINVKFSNWVNKKMIFDFFFFHLIFNKVIFDNSSIIFNFNIDLSVYF